jgi:chemotaxis protein CheD
MLDISLMDIFLLPGEYFVGDAAFQVRTILGSCVSITLWHPIARVGGMSHFLLPTRGSAGTTRSGLNGHYGDEALALMCQDLQALGVDPQHCQAKLFGGGNMFPGRVRSGSVHVGRRNGEAARELLLQHGIPIATESLFGMGHRQIIFDISKGDVWSRQVRPSARELAAEVEADVQEGVFS